MFDLAIIGGGIAGFSAAITASKLGLKVALIEQHQIGGTCLNIGCIPTKSLFQSAMLVKMLSNKENFGFVGVNPKFDWLCFRHNSEIIIKQIRATMVLQLKNANVNIIKSIAHFSDSNQLYLSNGDRIEAKKFVIAIGSSSTVIPNTLGIQDFWHLAELPTELTILGGGVIGCELAGILSQLGVRVNLVEKNSRLLALWDDELVECFTQQLIKSKVNLCLNKDSSSSSIQLNVTGRAPNKLAIPSGEHIITVGDAKGGIQLATKAEDEGSNAVRQLFLNKNATSKIYPQAVFSFPELASWGLTEQECQKSGIDYCIEKVHFSTNAKSIIQYGKFGWVKTIKSKKGEILGRHIIGSFASELIQDGLATAVHPSMFELLRQ